MRWPTSWNDTVKAAALATQAERTAATVRIAVDAPWNWNHHAVWLSRARPSRELQVSNRTPTSSGRTGSPAPPPRPCGPEGDGTWSA